VSGDVDTHIFDDPALDARFAETGFLVRPFLDAEQVQTMTALHAEFAPPAASDFSATLLTTFETRWRVFEECRVRLSAPLRRILPFHTLALAAFVTKRARTTTGRVPLHQDICIGDNRRAPALVCWCPLIDVGPDNAGLKVVPGTHRLFHQPYPINPTYRASYHARLAELDRECAVSLTVPAGSAVIYDQRVLHGSDENRSDHPRPALNCMLVRNGRSPRLYDWNADTPDRMRVFEADVAALCRFQYGSALDAEHGEGLRLLDTIDVPTESITEDDIAGLRRLREAAAS
jgi:hypothetical protein